MNSQMIAPKTLLELSNVPRPEIRLETSVLVIIDAQQEYETGRLPLVGLKEAVHSIRTLLTQARESGVPIIHVLHEGSEGGSFDPRTSAFKSIAGLEPLASESVVFKHLPNSFAGTNLTSELEKIDGNRTLLLVGFMTHMCITATASSALDLGFQIGVVKDAVATRDLRGPDGETIPARQVNQRSLAALQDRFAWLVASKEVIA